MHQWCNALSMPIVSFLQITTRTNRSICLPWECSKKGIAHDRIAVLVRDSAIVSTGCYRQA